jgi:hypothetical protein
MFKIEHQWAYLNYKLLSDKFSSKRVPEQAFEVKYIHSFYIISVFVYIWNHVVELLSIRIVSEVNTIDNSRGSSECFAFYEMDENDCMKYFLSFAKFVFGIWLKGLCCYKSKFSLAFNLDDSIQYRLE